MSDELGIDLWIKRDDLTGFAMGGNKGRKLEYLMGEALKRGADTIITCGSAQSNFVRQLAAACSIHRIRFIAVVMPLPYEFEPTSGGLSDSGGNVLLDEILGADLRVLPNGTWDELFKATKDVAEECRSKGAKVYEIPIGGSSPQGAYAFYEAGLELINQNAGFDVVVGASSSGSTQTGLTYAFSGTGVRFLGIACDPEPEMIHEFAALATELDKITGLHKKLSAEDFEFDLRYFGPGYGVPSVGGNAAIQMLARFEGIFLDPIYSGKAFHALIEMARSGELTGRVCFWHTGGSPALFAMT
jgi:1-aminocyclopropane-1-carboxylate deaminase/D-cysteine desulfhydrase-like pyridoxal-dependent ACC family enzyme